MVFTRIKYENSALFCNWFRGMALVRAGAMGDVIAAETACPITYGERYSLIRSFQSFHVCLGRFSGFPLPELCEDKWYLLLIIESYFLCLLI